MKKKYADVVDVLDQLEAWVREIYSKAGLCVPLEEGHVPPGPPIAAPSRPDQPLSHVPPETIADDPLARVRIPCFGDQLTRVRLAGAKDLRAGSHTPQDRLHHLYPIRIVDWHTKRSFLKVSTILQLNKPVFEISKFTLGHKVTGNEAQNCIFTP